jgi:hypothetical protein
MGPEIAVVPVVATVDEGEADGVVDVPGDATHPAIPIVRIATIAELRRSRRMPTSSHLVSGR